MIPAAVGRPTDVPIAPTSLDVLLVEDNPGDVLLIEEMAAARSRRSTERLCLRSAGLTLPPFEARSG